MTSTIQSSEQTQRVIFLDKIRYSMVLGVVLLHAACAYATIIPWWSVLDSDRSQIFDLLIIFLDVYQMPVLFFLAGYFALNSLKRYGVGGFVRSKLKRLGLPLLLVGIFFIPIVPYIGYALRDEQAMGFFQYWQMQMVTAMDWHWVHITTEEIAARHAQDFSQWHLWFISLLLIFLLAIASLAKLFPQLLQLHRPAEAIGSRQILKGIAVTGLAGAALMTGIHHISPDWTWAKVGGFILVQPTRIPLYAAFFTLGLYACASSWFQSKKFPVSPWLWLAAGMVLSVILLMLLTAIGQRPAPIPWGLAGAHSFVRMYAALSFLGFLLSAGRRWGQRPSAAWRLLHPISYDIYLIHLPLVIILQLLALYVPIPAAGKFFLVGLLGVAASWVIGRTIVTPYPRLAVVLLLAGFGVTALLLN